MGGREEVDIQGEGHVKMQAEAERLGCCSHEPRNAKDCW
jgi:hypothetical protein